MSDTAGTSMGDTGAPESASSGPGEQAVPQSAGGGNPAWGDLRSGVGESTFKLIEPYLQKYDQSASDRITRSNADLQRYTDLGDFDTLQAGHGIYQQIAQDPMEFFGRLQDMLRENGYDLGDTPAEGTVGEEGEYEEQDPREARINELEQAMEQMLSTQQSDIGQRQVAAWQGTWDQAFDAARESAPWLSDDDDGTLRRLAQSHVQSDDDDVSQIFSKALTDLTNIRNRAISAPRANESAPRLIQAGGGNPAAAQPQDVGKMGRSQTVDLVTQMLEARRGQR